MVSSVDLSMAHKLAIEVADAKVRLAWPNTNCLECQEWFWHIYQQEFNSLVSYSSNNERMG